MPSVFLLACAASLAAAPPPSPAAPATPALPAGIRAIALPGAGPDGAVRMDFIGYEPGAGRVWVPAGNTGSVDVIGADGTVVRVEGFPTKEVERNGKKRVIGPSSIAFGRGFAYVGNRGDDSVCAVDEQSLVRKGCVILDDMPDALDFVPGSDELWVTTPASHAVAILDLATPGAPAKKSRFEVDGVPECDAVDAAGGLWFTNLEDKDRTVAVSLADHRVVATWSPQCGGDGPKGLAWSPASRWLFVACPDHVEVLDAAHDGKLLSKADTGGGVDAITWSEEAHRLFVGSAEAGRLSVLSVGPDGTLSMARQVATAPGARNAVVDAAGAAWLTDSSRGRILIVPAE